MTKDFIEELCSFANEKEWFEFKENWFEKEELGEYISALSNAAAYYGKKTAYFIWGVNDETHEIVGTDFDFDCSVKIGKNGNEPLKHYLSRLITPNIFFEFEEEYINSKRLVILSIGAAKVVPTEFAGVRFIRIGSSKERLTKYPEKEAMLFKVLTGDISTIENTESEYQDLTFMKLFGYYGSKGIVLKEETFKKNLGLLTNDGKYNIMAQLLSDDSRKPLRVSIFEGVNKASSLFSIREFGNNCLLYSLDDLLRFGNLINVPQVDETNRVVERKETLLFDGNAYREAIVNAILHNKWIDGNEPMITVYSDRIEILSRGNLALNQTRKGFFAGESIPVNEKLSQIFLQLHISEKSGRGVPKIVDVYGESAFTFNEHSIIVTIPFNRIRQANDHIQNKRSGLNKRRERIVSLIKDNENITISELAIALGISETSVNNNIKYLKINNYIERIGKPKDGYWKVVE